MSIVHCNYFCSISVFILCSKLFYKYIQRWILSFLFNKSQHNSQSQCAINRCCTCPHAQFQVYNHTQNLLMTPHQPRANCQPPHTLPVSEKSCGFVEVHQGGRHYHTATETHLMCSDILSYTSHSCPMPIKERVKFRNPLPAECKSALTLFTVNRTDSNNLNRCLLLLLAVSVLFYVQFYGSL